jgi:hypothetical protein
VDERVLRRATSLELEDFEDSVAAAAAEAAGCELIVTRDPSGFARSPVAAMEPLLALAVLDSEVHERAAEYGRRRRRPSRRGQ